MARKNENNAYELGYNDYFEGVPRDDYLYADDTQDAEDWYDGWDQADSDDDSN